MREIKKIAVWILFLALFAGQTYGDITKSGQSGLQFLEFGPSARAEGMGGAFTLAGIGAEAVFYNPAGIAYSRENFDISVNHIKWIADIAYSAASAVYSPAKGNYGVFGISFRTAQYGDFLGTVVDPTVKDGFRDTGTFTPTAFSVGIAYAKQLTDRFFIGGQVKYLTHTLGTSIVSAGGSPKENKVSGLAFDFGTIYHTGIESLKFGMYIRNFAGGFTFERYQFDAPLIFRIGLSMNMLDFFPGENKISALLLAIDAVHPRDDDEHLDIGLEYRIWNKIFARGGYRLGYDIRSFTVGIGLQQNIGGLNIKIDYSYGALKFFNNVQQFTVGFSF